MLLGEPQPIGVGSPRIDRWIPPQAVAVRSECFRCREELAQRGCGLLINSPDLGVREVRQFDDWWDGRPQWSFTQGYLGRVPSKASNSLCSELRLFTEHVVYATFFIERS